MGTTWKQIDLAGLPDDIDPESSPIRNLTFFNDEEGVLFVIIRSQDLETSQIFIYGTQDGGLTWELESGPITIDKKTYGGTVTVFISRLNGFLNSENGLSITHDGGKTWTFVAWPPCFKSTDEFYIEPQLNFVSPSIGWAVLRKISRSRESPTETTFLKTTDGGLTWAEISPVFIP